MRALEQRGLVIACDWATAAPGLSKAEMAARDIGAMFRAQVLVAVMTLKDYEYKGTWTEIGMAIGRRIPIVLVSPFNVPEDAVCARNVYFHNTDFVRYPSTASLLQALDSK